MAAANESQGLKIAVAAFVTLTVILAVTSYFLYSAYSKSEAQLEAAQEKLRTAQKAQNDAVNQYDDFRKIAGVRAEEADPAKAEVTAYFKKTDDRIGNLATTVSAAIKQAQDAGATAAELEDAKAKVQTIVTSYRNEPNKNFISTEDRLVELLENLTLLSTQLSANYVGIRRRPGIVQHQRQTADRRSGQGGVRQQGRSRGRAQQTRVRTAVAPDQGQPASDRQRQEGDRNCQSYNVASSIEGRERPQARDGQHDHPGISRPGRASKRMCWTARMAM